MGLHRDDCDYRQNDVHLDDSYWTSWGKAGRYNAPPGAISHWTALCRSGDAHRKHTQDPAKVTCPACRERLEQGVTTKIGEVIEFEKMTANFERSGNE